MNSMNLLRAVGLTSNLPKTSISTSAHLAWVQMRTRCRIVDNSVLGREAKELGKAARCIAVYNRRGKGNTGDKILVAVRGQKKQAYIVGSKVPQDPFMPRFQTNNIVLINEDGTPIGTRITVPIPQRLRYKEGDFSKILAIATKFV